MAASTRTLRLRYPAGKLFVVNQDFDGSQLLDIRLAKGTVVAVLKEGDPMGNKNRFFVDNGCTPYISYHITLYSVGFDL